MQCPLKTRGERHESQVQGKPITDSSPKISKGDIIGPILLLTNEIHRIRFDDMDLFLMRKLRQKVCLEERDHVGIHFHHRDRLHLFLFCRHEGIVAQAKAIGDDLSVGARQRLFHRLDLTHDDTHPHMAVFSDDRKSDALIKETDIRIAKRPFCRIALMIGLEEFPAKIVGRPQLDRPRLRFRCMHMDVVGILRHQRGVIEMGVLFDLLHQRLPQAFRIIQITKRRVWDEAFRILPNVLDSVIHRICESDIGRRTDPFFIREPAVEIIHAEVVCHLSEHDIPRRHRQQIGF